MGEAEHRAARERIHAAIGAEAAALAAAPEAMLVGWALVAEWEQAHER